MPKLVYYDLDGKTIEVPLKQDSVMTIGRSSNSSIILLDIFVSRNHSEIFFDGKNYIIRDVGSSGGTYLNNEKVNESVLKHKDKIKLGKTVLTFIDDESSDSIDKSAENGLITTAEIKAEVTPKKIEYIESKLSEIRKSIISGKIPDCEAIKGKLADLEHDIKNIRNEVADISKSKQIAKAMYDVGRLINSIFDLDKLLNLIMELALKVMRAKRGFIMLCEPGTRKLTTKVARNMESMEHDKEGISHSIAQQVAIEGKPILTQDALSDPRFMKRASIITYNIHSVICSPLLDKKNDVIGVIYVDQLATEGGFSEDDMEFLTAFANQASLAIENANLYQKLAEKERMERELEIAREIQQNLLPEKNPDIKGLEIRGFTNPAKEVGGDFYDFIMFEDDKDSIGIICADVSGKGVPGAMIMALSRSIIRSEVIEHKTPIKVLNSVNKSLLRDIKKGKFVATIYALFDIKNNLLHYSSAGQPLPILIDSKGCSEVSGKSYLPLGCYSKVNYEEFKINLKKDDICVFYTDGIVEAMNEKGEMFGFERFMELLSTCKNKSSDEVIQETRIAINDFVGNTPQNDDITMVVVRVK